MGTDSEVGRRGIMPLTSAKLTLLSIKCPMHDGRTDIGDTFIHHFCLGQELARTINVIDDLKPSILVAYGLSRKDDSATQDHFIVPFVWMF